MPEIIVALDFGTVGEAEAMVRMVDADWYKIGMELAFAPNALEFAQDLGKPFFLDLKLRDIDTTVRRAVSNIVRTWRPKMLSVSVFDERMSPVVVDTLLVHVPTLTSDENPEPVFSDAYGVVCRASMVPAYRTHMPWAVIIVPGIRLPGMDADDHQEPGLPMDADFWVVGRPITHAPNPRAAYEEFLEIAKGD